MQVRRPRSNSANAGTKALTEFDTPEGIYSLRGGKLFPCQSQKGRSGSSSPQYFAPKNCTTACPSKLSFVIPKKAENSSSGQAPILISLNYRDALKTYPFPLADHDFSAVEIVPWAEPDYSLAVQSHCFNTLGRGNYARLVSLVSGDILVRIYDNKTNKAIGKDLRFNAPKYIQGVTHAAWMPQSDNLFVVSSSDGRLYFLDKALVEMNKESLQWEKDSTETRHFTIYQPVREGLNPVSIWEISSKAITGFSFAPNGVHVATIGKDCILRIFNIDEKMQVAAFKSYYGAFLCVTWSADSRFVLTGGEDDLVNIFDPFVKKSLVARGKGHQSWITHVSFDPYLVDANGHTVPNLYRFGSVAEDGLLMLWDYHAEPLDAEAEEMHVATEDSTGVVPAPSRDDENVVTLEPIVSHHFLHTRPLTDLCFFPDALVTASSGFAKIWNRPAKVTDNDTEKGVADS